MERTRAGGFTLIELILILVLLGLLAAVAVPRFFDLGGQARINVTKERLEHIKRAILGDPSAVSGGTFSAPGYWGDMGRLPSTLGELSTQGGQPAWNKFTRRGWNGPYIESSQFTDAWGNAICFRTAPCASPCPAVATSSRSFTLQSAGPDGILCNSDDLTLDITF